MVLIQKTLPMSIFVNKNTKNAHHQHTTLTYDIFAIAMYSVHCSQKEKVRIAKLK